MGVCPSGDVYDAGLCYPECREGFSGIGPVCYGNCPPNTSDSGAICIKHSRNRGTGTLPTCPTGTYQDVLLCYPNCKSGFTGNGPVCWGVCPPGYPDFDGFCGKPPGYGRGAGHETEQACVTSGDPGAATNGCELYGLLWYPICNKGFHNFGCCICVADCPPGFRDDGATCYKPSYPNSAGTLPDGCPDDKEYDVGLCYPKCDPGFSGVLTICYADCSGETTDTGLQCQKDTYGRGAGTIPGIISPTVKYIIIAVGIIIALIIISITIYVIYSFA